jgi:small redox-active disulfide protein 2
LASSGERKSGSGFPLPLAAPLFDLEEDTMKSVIVYGPGCKRCETTAAMVKAAAERLGVPVTVEKVTDMAAIAMAGVLATPGVAVDGALVHAGGLPKAEDIDRWLA